LRIRAAGDKRFGAESLHFGAIILRASPILAVVGTRPEAIKAAPVLHALHARGLGPGVILTGQHPQLDLVAYGLDRFPLHRLACPGQTDPQAHAEQVAAAVAPLLDPATELLIVQGDTSSALGGALAGFRRDVPVAHVEAGLRTFDPALPWPEEDNRVAIDREAALLFAPTEVSAANLRAEGVPGEVHVTGNTGIDALRSLLRRVPVPRLRAVNERPRLLVTCHRRENWGENFLPVAEALLHLEAGNRLQIDVLLPPNPTVAAGIREFLAGRFGIRLLPPLDHGAMLAAMRSATILLSDGGGVQEEAPALGVPLLVLRGKTERPEGVTSGNMRLVGNETGRIVAEVQRLLNDPDAYAAMAQPRLPYGDGHAAERIAAAIVSWLGRGAEAEERLTA
jgi:UDP-N-acetylglucosamine 2-epimerase (non-hydrolysing)